MVRFLLRAGANINRARNNGVTPLFMAAEKGRLEIVRALLGAGAHIDQAKNNDATPLFIAAHKGRVEIVDLLLRAGANIRLTWRARTPLEQAVRNGHKEIVKLLAQHPKTTCRMIDRLIYEVSSDDIEEILQECIDGRLKLADEIGLSAWKIDTLDQLYEAYGDHLFNAKSDKAEIVARQITNEIEARLRRPISRSTLAFSEIKPLVTVNEANLSTIIARLESQNTGESLLACALLLLRYIKNEVGDRGREAQQENDTNRKLSAIRFLDKAAKVAPRLRESISHLLWELKGCDNPHVRAYLAPYDVRPMVRPARSRYTLFPPSELQETIVSVPGPMPPPPSI